MGGNKIDIKEIKAQEVTIAKCGLLELICVVYPRMDFISYEIRTDGRTIFETGSLQKAILKYNDFV